MRYASSLIIALLIEPTRRYLSHYAHGTDLTITHDSSFRRSSYNSTTSRPLRILSITGIP